MLTVSRRAKRPTGNGCAATDARRSSAARGRALGVGVGQDHEELLAAEARDDVLLAHARAQPRGEPAQHVVARAVAVAVVERLEAVGVEDHDRELLVVAAGAAEQRVELADGEAAVRDPGELVVEGERLEVVLAREQLLLHLLRPPRGVHAGDDLGRGRVVAQHVVGAVLERIDGRPDVGRLADEDDRDAEEVRVALDLRQRRAEPGVQQEDVDVALAGRREQLLVGRGLQAGRARAVEGVARRRASARGRVRDQHPCRVQRAVRGHCAT